MVSVNVWIGWYRKLYLSTRPRIGFLTAIGERLKEERERLKLSQSAFAALAGASKGSQIAWEKKDGPSPSAADLERFAAAGADVLYIITGKRTPAAGQSPPVNVDVLRQVIEGVEEILSTSRRKPEPGKKAEAIVLLYEHFHIAGRVERGFIERQLRLVA